MLKKKDLLIIAVVLLAAVALFAGSKDAAQDRPFHQDGGCDARAGRD
ncbi:MAG: hypothetical protein ACLUHE_02040 [Christensenellales bacterium]